MKPHLYLYEEQLRDLLIKSKPGEINRAVAFEWKGENVFHVYTKFPKVAPSGYPTIAFFHIDTDKFVFDNCERNFKSISENFFGPGIDAPNSIIGIFLYLDKEKLLQCAFRKTATGIEECEIKYVPEKSDLYSRSKGLVEIEILAEKKVLIIGLGSFGSQIAIELAKSGVGKFSLVDFDRIELSNIARHICGVNDLGRLKTLAVRDAIFNKNPFAEVETFEIDVNESLEVLNDLIRVSDLVICVTDNNRSRFNINEIAFDLNKPVIYGRAVTRAEGGDVFISRGRVSPCYTCLIGENNGMKFGGEEEITSQTQAEHVMPAYTTSEQKSSVIQVGLSSDILPMCNLIVKLALVELSRGLNSGISSLEDELTYDYYFWANRREKKLFKLPTLQQLKNAAYNPKMVWC